jgi:hypothetical protein
MSHASPQDVIARLPWDSSEIDDDSFLSTGDIQSYLDEAYDLLAPVVSVAAGLSADSLDATTIGQMRSAECDYAIHRALEKMQQGAGEQARRAFERWDKTFRKYADAPNLLHQQGANRTLTNAPTSGRASVFAGRSYRGH